MVSGHKLSDTSKVFRLAIGIIRRGIAQPTDAVKETALTRRVSKFFVVASGDGAANDSLDRGTFDSVGGVKVEASIARDNAANMNRLAETLSMAIAENIIVMRKELVDFIRAVGGILTFDFVAIYDIAAYKNNSVAYLQGLKTAVDNTEVASISSNGGSEAPRACSIELKDNVTVNVENEISTPRGVGVEKAASSEDLATAVRGRGAVRMVALTT